MTQRITEKDLEQCVNVINTRLGLPTEPYGKTESDGFMQNPEVYVIDHANGGVKLEQNCADTGKGSHGVCEISGRGTKHELHTFLLGFITGLEAAENAD